MVPVRQRRHRQQPVRVKIAVAHRPVQQARAAVGVSRLPVRRVVGPARVEERRIALRHARIDRTAQVVPGVGVRPVQGEVLRLIELAVPRVAVLP